FSDLGKDIGPGLPSFAIEGCSVERRIDRVGGKWDNVARSRIGLADLLTEPDRGRLRVYYELWL
ncbi:MAG: hypothetical protein NTU41_02110, partial [Chloroflexi bacterium]|nr:hypothetical protein [Chloroflexota bacterium]